jgi:predicted PurR-regulated permease PerM
MVTTYYNLLDPSAAGAVASVLNNTVDNLFNKGIKEEQQNLIKVQEKLALLSNSQQDQLNQQLAQTTDKNQQLQILLNAIGGIQAASVTSAGKKQVTLAVIILAGSILVVLSIFLYRKTA